MSKRSHDIMVRLDDREVAVLDEHRGSTPRATYLRRLLHEAPKEQEVASRAEAMAILTRLARDGKTQAALCTCQGAPRGRRGRLDELDPRCALSGTCLG